jgi:predicted nucleic acid-binding protein
VGTPHQTTELAVKRWLIDTGPCVAYFDRRDAFHEQVAATLDPFTGQLVTTPAVVTEVMHFLGDAPNGPQAFAEFLTSADVRLLGVTDPEDVAAAARLMRRYTDTPMDFADATLVQVADATGVTDILTLDRRGFSTYRTGSGRRFRLVLRP